MASAPDAAPAPASVAAAPGAPPTVPEGLNVPTPERLDRLQRLENLIGPVPIYFWAAAHICDMGKLDLFIQIAELSPHIFRDYTQAAKQMITSYATEAAKQMITSCKLIANSLS